jgi:hypothetical protein
MLKARHELHGLLQMRLQTIEVRFEKFPAESGRNLIATLKTKRNQNHLKVI